MFILVNNGDLKHCFQNSILSISHRLLRHIFSPSFKIHTVSLVVGISDCKIRNVFAKLSNILLTSKKNVCL